MKRFDVVILGAGGAGMMCAMTAGNRGRSVALLDHAEKVGGKIIISGGGRCNFTNVEAGPKNYVSRNEHFAKSALSRYTPADFIALVEKHGIAYHERKHRQLFCDVSARLIIDMLVRECKEAGAEMFLKHAIKGVRRADGGFVVETDHGEFASGSLVVALGGLSIPKIGATGFGYELARQFGLRLVETAPALDGFVFSESDRQKLSGFEGIAIDASMSCNGISFRENLLFTHAGLSGPVSLQASLHWYKGDEVAIDFVPQLSREALLEWFWARRSEKAELKNLMGDLVPKRLAERFCELYLPGVATLGNVSKKDLEAFCDRLKAWSFVPACTVGYGKAEVTRGGVDTDELSSKTMECKKVPGLYFIGEVVDVTGWLGGFNFQWAWASGWAAGQAV
ncbi:MAG: NAD(P)/FAD-dependent oxidoreductase [Deltaproteobacteria bacterium]|nr:NAD(P)/FAD-dependent oxidoreductase [Deltaproteobacteria bacterium]